jgi:cytoskeletal protein CcmA (bactofilin family)
MRPRAVLLSVLLVFALLPGLAAADSRASDRVVVDAGERVDSVTATGGVVIVRGTVDGDLEAAGGRVVVEDGGRITGRLRASGGVVVINGTVEENALAYGGRVHVGETGVVERSLGAGAGVVRIDGTVGGDATVGAREITLGSTATIRGDLNYDGDLADEGGTVEGQRRESSDLGLVPSVPLPGIVLDAYWLLANAALGVVLLAVFPRYTWAAANTIGADTLWTAAAGIASVIVVPIVLALIALTVVGLPLTLVGAAGFFAVCWVGSVIARYAIGSWLLSLADRENRWAALGLGLVVVAILGRLPVVGLLVQAVVLVLGVGVVALGVRAAYVVLRDHPGGVTSL